MFVYRTSSWRLFKSLDVSATACFLLCCSLVHSFELWSIMNNWFRVISLHFEQCRVVKGSGSRFLVWSLVNETKFTLWIFYSRRLCTIPSQVHIFCKSRSGNVKTLLMGTTTVWLGLCYCVDPKLRVNKDASIFIIIEIISSNSIENLFMMSTALFAKWKSCDSLNTFGFCVSICFSVAAVFGFERKKTELLKRHNLYRSEYYECTFMLKFG